MPHFGAEGCMIAKTDFESAASAIPPLRRANILGHLRDRGNLRLQFYDRRDKWPPQFESAVGMGEHPPR
jgi:hypothetical protein